MNLIAYFDLEVSSDKNIICDIGAIRSDDAVFHKNSVKDFLTFIQGCQFLVGHNALRHDLYFLQKQLADPNFGIDCCIDTLLLAPLVFPARHYHKLLKDEKFDYEETNNPCNDAIKAKELFLSEVDQFRQLDRSLQTIFYSLLQNVPGYRPFFQFVNFDSLITSTELDILIRTFFKNQICDGADIGSMINDQPVALAYALALINGNDRFSITPAWVLRNHPQVERLLFLLCNRPCTSRCEYCQGAFDPRPLFTDFGISEFRKFDNQPLQENAVNAAIESESILVIFPTGGGKSVTFQLPALLSGRNAKALTVVISPLQSLMKDQVDNLEKKSITEAVTINGLLDPIERCKAIERVENGSVSLLYISPESLRSITIERLLLKRKIARFVIDEAHCFSSWGQDFRVDYLYIAEFIKTLQDKKCLVDPIPVSCFTATAKPKVIEDIKSYFKENLNLNLDVYRATSSRSNLHYEVLQKNNDEEKYNELRNIIEQKSCPSIVYVSRTKRASKLAARLVQDGFDARPFHGKMDKDEKKANQNAFMAGEVNIMVATSAFGMGVDKDDVGTVIHYDISDSLENYVQEAGRAGRRDTLKADCYVLFNEEDLDSHFIRLNQAKLSGKEINQIWKTIKELTRTRNRVSHSALEIARKAGWDDNIAEVETRVKTAITALEDAGYVKRGQNMPRVYANSILLKSAQEAVDKINGSEKIEAILKPEAVRIIKKLFSSKSKRLSTEEEAESRIDYISDQLGIVKERVIRIIELLKAEGILAQTMDLTAFTKRGESSNKSNAITECFCRLEDFVLKILANEEGMYHLKGINEQAINAGITESTVAKLKTVLNFWGIKQWIKRYYPESSKNHVQVQLLLTAENFRDKLDRRHQLARIITDHLYKKVDALKPDDSLQEVLIEFSVQELKEVAERSLGLFKFDVTIDDVEDTLFYLSRIEAIKMEGGFLVIHNKLSIDRLEMNNQIQYKKSDYAKLATYYEQKVQQIHIVGEYAKKMIENYKEALEFVDDYFKLNYSSFLKKYFRGTRADDINRSLTPEKFTRLFGQLSPDQLAIIKDNEHPHIVVAAGPGSGKTRELVHKLASLLIAEDVKHEQLLMLTFSRAAATEFKKRVIALIGRAAAYIEIKTFHSYCFDLLGKVGNLDQSDRVLKLTVEKIRSGDIEASRITKTVLVIDEAQDMNADEFELVKALMEVNEDMTVILVGDDDQNIYGFRGADSKYMEQLISERNAEKYQLTTNYRSKANIVGFSNHVAATISHRLKTQPGLPQQPGLGNISVTQYTGNNLIVPVSTAIQLAELVGSTCILTNTNDEAALLTGLLIKNGIQAKLIQSNDGFRLDDLYELRYFSSKLGRPEDSPVIREEDWSNAIGLLSDHARRSSKLDLALRVINEFSSVNENRKYQSDWQAFLAESKVEDFISIDNEIIYVSTSHKAKGKEFDNVYVLLNGFKFDSDEQKRKLYVAVTRAKDNLNIHYNGTYLQSLKTDGLLYHHDRNVFSDPIHLASTLSHKDIYLRYFEFVQPRMDGLMAGDNLEVVGNEGLANSKGQLVLKYSKSFQEKLTQYAIKGYGIKGARINFIVYWKNTKDDKEWKIILPELFFEKVQQF